MQQDLEGLVSSLESSSSSNQFDPLPVQCAGSMSRRLSLEPYPLLSQPTSTFSSSNLSSSSNWNSPSTMAPITQSSNARINMQQQQADEILDEAVDELFDEDPLFADAADLSDVWDSSAFGEEGVQDDTQLGFLLEKLMGNE